MSQDTLAFSTTSSPTFEPDSKSPRSFNPTIQEVADNFGFDKEQAKLLITYHGKIRGELNALLTQGQIIGRFDPKQGATSEAAELAQDTTGAIPVVGGIISAGIGLLRRAVYFFEKRNVTSDLTTIQNMNASGDPREWHDFTRDIATRMVMEKAAEIAQLPDKDAARKMAQDDSQKIAENLFDKTLVGQKDIVSDREELINIVTKARERDSQESPSSSSPRSPTAIKLAGQVKQI
jgi:hypothetical protein